MEDRMPQVTVGKWGKNLAIRLPGEIVKAAGLSNGERLEIETQGGKLSSVARFRISAWRSCFVGSALKSGGQLMPYPLIGGLMSVVRSSRNDFFCLFARHRRSHLDGLRPDQWPRTGPPAPGSGSFS